MTDQYEVQFSTKLKRPDMLRIGIVVACALVLLVSAAVTIAASPSPSPAASSPSQQGGPSTGGNWGPGRGFAGTGPGMPGKGHGFGGPGFREFGFGQITISAINGSSLSLRTADGWSRTITVTGSTTIMKAGQTIAVGDLKVGDTIRFKETRNADGSFTINAIEVVLPQVEGTVASVTSSGFTVKAVDGSTWTITVTGSTTYSLGTQSASLSDVKVGNDVDVEGSQASGTSMTASAVHLALPTVVGEVTAKTASTITVRLFDGSSATIHVGGGTTYQAPGISNPSLANVTVGALIAAEGTRNADGSLSATVVRTGPGKGVGFGNGAGKGWGRGFGGRPGAPAPPGASGTSGFGSEWGTSSQS